LSEQKVAECYRIDCKRKFSFVIPTTKEELKREATEVVLDKVHIVPILSTPSTLDLNPPTISSILPPVSRFESILSSPLHGLVLTSLSPY